MELLGILFMIAFYVGIIVLFYKWGASIMKDKNRDEVLGGITGVLGGLIGIIVLYCIPKKEIKE